MNSSSSKYTPAPIALQELLALEMPPLRWVIPDILPEGLILLAGKPKLGKSWLALEIALAIAAGGSVLGKLPVVQGGVLYLALEDHTRRLQSRAKQLLASMTCVPSGIEFETRWPRFDQGGLLHLENYLKAHSYVRLVVIDTWAKVAPQWGDRQRSQYDGDYRALTPLKYLADTYRVSLVVVHHLRKTAASDVLDEITGSIAMAGVVDGAMVLKRERGRCDASLYVTGRDIEREQQLQLRFDANTALWMLVGNTEQFMKRTKERQEILDLLSRHYPLGMSPRQVAETLRKNYHTVRSLLRKMEEAREIQHTNNHYFAVPLDAAEGPAQYQNDGTDYGDDAGDRSALRPPQVVRRYVPLRSDAEVLQTSADHLIDAEEWQQVHGHQRDPVLSAINRNHCHQPSTQPLQKQSQMNTASLSRRDENIAANGKPRRHLEVFDYVTTPRGKGVVICSRPYLLGVILDTSQEVVHFKRPEDIDLIQPATFVSVPSSSEELRNAPGQEDEYQYLDPYGWPYNDPDMTDEYLSACGFPTREAAGYPVPTKPAHVERLRGATIVSTPKGRGKLWLNWDTQVGVILEGTRYVTIFHTPEEWAQILPVYQDPQRGIDEMRA